MSCCDVSADEKAAIECFIRKIDDAQACEGIQCCALYRKIGYIQGVLEVASLQATNDSNPKDLKMYFEMLLDYIQEQF